MYDHGLGEGALEVVEEALVVLGPADGEAEVFLGRVVQVSSVLAIVGHEGLAEHGDAEEGLHGLDGGREGILSIAARRSGACIGLWIPRSR